MNNTVTRSTADKCRKNDFNSTSKSVRSFAIISPRPSRMVRDCALGRSAVSRTLRLRSTDVFRSRNRRASRLSQKFRICGLRSNSGIQKSRLLSRAAARREISAAGAARGGKGGGKPAGSVGKRGAGGSVGGGAGEGDSLTRGRRAVT